MTKYFPFREEGLFGFRNSAGEVAVKPKYRYASMFENGFAYACDTKDRYCTIRESDFEITNVDLAYCVEGFSHGFFLIQEKGSGFYGFLNVDHEIAVSPTYCNALPVDDYHGAFVATMHADGPLWGRINENGELIEPASYSSIWQFLPGGRLTGAKTADGDWRIVDAEFQVHSKESYYRVNPQHDNKVVVNFEDEHWGWLDEELDVAGECSDLDWLGFHFSNGKIPFQQNSRWGVLRDDGDYCIEPVFDWIGEKTGGYWPARKGEDRYGLLFENGGLALEFTLSSSPFFIDGLAKFYFPNPTDLENDLIAVVDEKLNFLWKESGLAL